MVYDTQIYWSSGLCLSYGINPSKSKFHTPSSESLYPIYRASVHKVPRLSLKRITPLEHLFQELLKMHLSRYIKSITELYGQRLYICRYRQGGMGHTAIQRL
jgi:hypothetical protein